MQLVHHRIHVYAGSSEVDKTRLPGAMLLIFCF